MRQTASILNRYQIPHLLIKLRIRRKNSSSKVEVLLIQVQFGGFVVLTYQSIELHDQNSLPNQLLEGIGPVQTIYAVCPDHPVLELYQLLV